jgi:glycosyltransferase involved in cell wall biosynthesis
MPDAPLRICVVSHFAYDAFTGRADGRVGGVEWQTSLLARWLARRGHDVSLVTWDQGQADGARVDGVRLFAICPEDAGLPGLRFLHPRWTGLAAALSRAEADVYYQNCAEAATGQVAWWARRHGRRFVYSLASDMHCDPALPDLATWRERALYRYGLRRADVVVAQTRAQQERLRTDWGRESVQVALPCPAPVEAPSFDPPEGARPRVLWLGRVCAVKRPDRLLELAESRPQWDFDLVGPSDGSAPMEEVLARARRVANVSIHGLAPRAALPALFRGASALVCTSDREGVPNTFLEAWSHARPVVTTVDPDGVVAAQGLGAVGASVAELAAGLDRLLGDREAWRAAAMRAHAHFLAHHEADAVLARFEACFRAALAGAAA